VHTRTALLQELTNIEYAPVKQAGDQLHIVLQSGCKVETFSLPVQAQSLFIDHLMCSSLLADAFARGYTLPLMTLVGNFESCAAAYLRCVRSPAPN
jgi:hypothetical protein